MFTLKCFMNHIKKKKCFMKCGETPICLYPPRSLLVKEEVFCVFKTAEVYKWRLRLVLLVVRGLCMCVHICVYLCVCTCVNGDGL